MDDQLSCFQVDEVASQSWAATPQDAGAITLGVLANVLDEIDYGVMVIQSSGDVLLANHLARAVLETSASIKIRSDKLSAHTAKNTLAIERATLDAKNGLRRLIEIPSCKGSLHLSFAPLLGSHSQPYALGDPATPFVIVLIGKHVACNLTTLTEFGAVHRLSRAEQRLLPAIIQGAGIKEMAKQQKVSVCTVRTHLKNIRDKTGAISLRTLMLQLTTLPPLRSLCGDPSTH